MARRARSRNVEIFNFSFLDILACTIGLLIFIMVMVFILQAGSPLVDMSAVVQRKQAAAAADSDAAGRDAAIAEALEAQLAQFTPPEDHGLSARRDAARAERDAARAVYAQRTQEARNARAQLDAAREISRRDSLQAAQGRLKEAEARMKKAQHAMAAAKAPANDGRVTFLPRERPGEHNLGAYQVLHVDCQADKVVLLDVDASGITREMGHSPASTLADADSVFGKAVSRQQRFERPLVLFWVRPDGMVTFNRALAVLPEELPRGYEPADAAWHFDGNAPATRSIFEE